MIADEVLFVILDISVGRSSSVNLIPSDDTVFTFNNSTGSFDY